MALAGVAGWPADYDGPRSAATAIYFLLQPGEQSRWHVVRSDELWLWHSGGPVVLQIGAARTTSRMAEAAVIVLGDDLTAGHRPQAVVPGGVWQRAASAADAPVLVSCVVVPGFDFADFRVL